MEADGARAAGATTGVSPGACGSSDQGWDGRGGFQEEGTPEEHQGGHGFQVQKRKEGFQAEEMNVQRPRGSFLPALVSHQANNKQTKLRSPGGPLVRV